MNAATTLNLDKFLPHMRDVTRCEQSLRELNLTWRMIESSAKMNCPVEARAIIPTMSATREGFDHLEKDLVSSLVREKVANVLAEMGTKAQNVVDIVVRNLYERTADVGFLATDRELCAYVAGLSDDGESVRQRLLAYQRKYTVYDEIMLLDTSGSVLMQIDSYMQVEGSRDPLIAQTLASDSYVETFRASDLRPKKRQALIYSRKMHHPETNDVIGLLCLSFNFEQEMADIYRTHRDPAERSNMLLLDGDNRVVASADPLWIPIGAHVPVNHEASPALRMFGGREYLVRTCYAEGYQSYMGPPGWQGQVMVPAEVAFISGGSHSLSQLDHDIADGLLSHAKTFCPPLYDIMQAADTIRRVVWNGQVMTAGQCGDLLKLKTILDQISETGNRSNALFSHSIQDLYETVLSASLNDVEFAAHLLVDLLDRNLYERANDCRWWALTPELRAALAAPEQDTQTVDRLNRILVYINSLYTVYARLFVYDRSGRIITGTHPDDRSNSGGGSPSIAGECIDMETLAQVLTLTTEQDYHVTSFGPSPLYDHAQTYVYHAAIRHPDQPSHIVGGIGIVFDAAPEFSAMIAGGLGERTETTGFFVDRAGRIISSTDEKRPVGTMLDIDPSLLKLERGESAARIVLHDGHYAIMGCSASSGYREFKVTDGYQDDVLAVVFRTFGEIRVSNSSGYTHTQNGTLLMKDRAPAQNGVEFATFYIDTDLFAIPAEYVTEAFPGTKVTQTSMNGRPECIGVLALPQEVIWVFDLGYLIRGARSALDSRSQVMVVRHGDHTMGLLVSDLHDVPEFARSMIVATPLGQMSEKTLVPQVIKANNGELLIQVIDIACLIDLLLTPVAQD